MESVQAEKPGQRSLEERFVQGVIEGYQRDSGFAARLRRADNPSTEYQCWEVMASYGINLERENERLPFATIGAAIAKSKAGSNGSLSLGRAISACYEDGNQSDQAKVRLRRLLACDDQAELCRVMRPLLRLIDSRGTDSLNFVRLLRQMRHFGVATQRGDSQWQQNIKSQWAQEFYGHTVEVEEEG